LSTGTGPSGLHIYLYFKSSLGSGYTWTLLSQYINQPMFINRHAHCSNYILKKIIIIQLPVCVTYGVEQIRFGWRISNSHWFRSQFGPQLVMVQASVQGTGDLVEHVCTARVISYSLKTNTHFLKMSWR